MIYTPEEQEYLRQQGQLQPMQQPPPSKDEELMQGLLNFRMQTIEPLRHVWRGDLEIAPGEWKKRPGFEMMNEQGVAWCSGQLETFLTSTFSMSNLDEDLFNWNVRVIGKTIWNGISMLYLEWGMRKQNIPSVANGIIQTCVSVLLMARGDGLRRFLSTTHQISEMRNTQIQQQPQQRKGLFGIFKPKDTQPLQQEGY